MNYLQEISLSAKNKLLAKLANKLFLVNKNFFHIGIVQTRVDPAYSLFLADILIYSAIRDK